MQNETLSSLLDGLTRDSVRFERPFSTDITEAHAVLHHPWATEQERIECLRLFAKSRQPCFFGRVAAGAHALFICVIDERDVYAGDERVRDRIAEHKTLWKRRALGLHSNARPQHGFLLVLLSPRIAEARPDGELRRLAEHLRHLAGWDPEDQVARGGVSSDYLHLRNPVDGEFYGFRYNVDFFAAAGDGRWWHDHRFPGGIAFTANATGHMKHWKEWYESPTKDWSDGVLDLAMRTIAAAHPTVPTGEDERADPRFDPRGRITWLRDLGAAGPLKGSSCPFTRKVPPALEGKDWTTYEGTVHTDHAVRPALFDGRERPEAAFAPYLMDFTYLYDRAQEDYARFTGGIRRSREEVFAELGAPETWTVRAAEPTVAGPAPDQRREVARALEVCRGWQPLGGE